MIPKNSFGGSRALNPELTRRARRLLETDPRSKKSEAHVSALLKATGGVDGAINALTNAASNSRVRVAQKLRAGVFVASLAGAGATYGDIASALNKIHGDDARALGRGVNAAWIGRADSVEQVGCTVAHLVDRIQGKPTKQGLAFAGKVLWHALGGRSKEISLAKRQMLTFWSEREATRGA